MNFLPQELSGVFIIEAAPVSDERGLFRRHFCKREMAEAGIAFDVAQGNISENFRARTLRGFHYTTLPSKEDKILSCVAGRAWNVTIDVRPSSPTFRRQMSFEISADNRRSIFVPAGCANAFLTLTDNTIFHYYMGEYFGVARDRGFRFDDLQFAVAWPEQPLVVSEKDLQLPNFSAD